MTDTTPKINKLDPTFEAFRALRQKVKNEGATPDEADALMKLAYRLAKADPAMGPAGGLDASAIIAGIPEPRFGLGVGISHPTVNHDEFKANYKAALAAELEDRKAYADMVAATLKTAITAAGAALL